MAVIIIQTTKSQFDGNDAGIDKETELVQDDAPAETFVSEKIVLAEEMSDEKEDIEMQRLLRILLCFSCFGLLKLNAEHELMEMNFRKKGVFVHKTPIHKNLSQFCNNYQGLKDSV